MTLFRDHDSNFHDGIIEIVSRTLWEIRPGTSFGVRAGLILEARRTTARVCQKFRFAIAI